MSNRLLNGISAALALVLVGWVAWAVLATEPAAEVGLSAGPPLPTEPISIASAVSRGDADSPVAVVIYSDFQCPFCARFARETLPKLDEYVERGVVRVAFRHFPLTAIHPNAAPAAYAAECARRQGRFWEAHDLLFEDPDDLGAARLRQTGRQLGLGKEFETCLDDGSTRALVQSDLSAARSLRLSSTPTVMVGRVADDGTVSVAYRFGAVDYESLAMAIDTLLEQ